MGFTRLGAIALIGAAVALGAPQASGAKTLKEMYEGHQITIMIGYGFAG